MQDVLRKYSTLIAGTAKFIVSLLPSGEKVVKILEDDILGSDIWVSDFDEGGRVEALSGFKPVIVEDLPGAIYPEGCRLSMTLGHNKVGDNEIELTRMRLQVEQYLTGSFNSLSYRRQLEKLRGAQIVLPMKFLVRLDGRTIAKANWTSVPGFQPNLSIHSENLFDTTPPIRLMFSKDDKPMGIEGAIIAIRSGLYFLSLDLHYCIVGRGDFVLRRKLSIYKEDQDKK